MITPLMLLTILIALMPTAVLALIYARLPAQVPLHWGITGKPDIIGSKVHLWVLVGFFALLPLLLAFAVPQRPMLGVVAAGQMALVSLSILAVVVGRLNLWVFSSIVLCTIPVVWWLTPQL